MYNSDDLDSGPNATVNNADYATDYGLAVITIGDSFYLRDCCISKTSILIMGGRKWVRVEDLQRGCEKPDKHHISIGS